MPLEQQRLPDASFLLTRTIFFAQKLIRFPSITPHQAGCLDDLEDLLREWGFTCHRLPFGETDNLYARRGTSSPHLSYVGHIDVVPPGEERAWTSPPFEPILRGGALYGRGAVDMKGSIACFLAALESFLPTFQKGSLSLLLTSDEEGTGRDGLFKVKDWLRSRGEAFDGLLVGEPASENVIGDTLKIGRRGSLSGVLTVFGKQGHVAYPHKADNPIPRLLRTLEILRTERWDQGTPEFQPSHLEITSIDVGNPTGNIIPRQVSARFNIRFNPLHQAHTFQEKIAKIAETHAGKHRLDFSLSGEPFLSQKNPFHILVANAIEKVTGQKTVFSTSGGISDARHMHTFGPIVELGLKNETAHQVDEHVPLTDLEMLTGIYLEILKCFYA